MSQLITMAFVEEPPVSSDRLSKRHKHPMQHVCKILQILVKSIKILNFFINSDGRLDNCDNLGENKLNLNNIGQHDNLTFEKCKESSSFTFVLIIILGKVFVLKNLLCKFCDIQKVYLPGLLNKCYLYINKWGSAVGSRPSLIELHN